MRVRQNFIALENPLYEPNKTIKLTEEAERHIEMEKLSKLDKVKVAAVGETVQHIKEGDEVFLDPMRIVQAPRVIIDEKSYLFVREVDIVFIY